MYGVARQTQNSFAEGLFRLGDVTMARKVVSEQQANAERKYANLRILADGRVRYSSNPGPVPSVEFCAIRYHQKYPSGVWIYDSARYGLDARRNGKPTLLLFVKQSRVYSACFDFTLDPATLRRAVADLRKHGQGVEGWLAPALMRTQLSLTKLESNPAMLKAIPKLLESVRDLPVSAVWIRQVRADARAWKRWREQNPTAPATGHPLDPKQDDAAPEIEVPGLTRDRKASTAKRGATSRKVSRSRKRRP